MRTVHPQETSRFQEQVVVITGAASGIGRACIDRFLAEGARVAACDVNPDGLRDLEKAFAGHKERLYTALCDVTRRQDGERVAAQVLDRWERIDCLVNSAGITPRTVGPDADFEARWDAVMAVNAKGVFLMSHTVLPAMRAAGRGSIVNIASIMGLVGYPLSLPFSDGFTAYPHSKGAVIQMTRDMGVRFAPEGVRVNEVAPGFIYTALTDNVTRDPQQHAEMQRLHPIGRMGQPGEVAAAVAFLASDDASFIAGAVLTVDGGYTAQ